MKGTRKKKKLDKDLPKEDLLQALVDNTELPH